MAHMGFLFKSHAITSTESVGIVERSDPCCKGFIEEHNGYAGYS